MKIEVERSRSRRDRRTFFRIKGERLTMREAADKLNLTYEALQMRLRRGTELTRPLQVHARE